MIQGKLAKIGYWTLGSLVGLVLLLSAALSFLDWNQYRSTLSSLASGQLGMRVELAGDIKLGLFPHPLVSARLVRITPIGAGTDGAVATADRIEMQLGLSELLSGQLAVSQLNLDGLSLKVQQEADGRWRVRGWPESDTASGGATTAIQLDKLQVSGGRIDIQPYGKPARVVEDLTFQLSGLLPTGPFEWQGDFTTAGQKVTTDGRMRPSPDRGDVAFKADFGLDGGAVTLSGRLGAADGAGRVQLKGDSLHRFLTALQRVGTGTGGDAAVPDMAFSLDAQADRKGEVTRVVSRQVQVGDTQGRLDLMLAEKGSYPHVAGTLELGIIDLKPWLDAAKAAPDSGAAQPAPAASALASAPALDLPLRGTLDISVEALRVGSDAIQRLEAVLGAGDDGVYMTSLQGLLPGGSAVSFQGRVGATSGGEGQVSLTSGNLQQMLRWLGADVSKSVQPGRLATAELSGHLAVTPAAWQLDGLKGKVDTVTLSGALAGGRADGMPTAVTLSADQVNLDAYMSETSGGTADIAALLPPKAMTFDLTAGTVQWHGNQYDSVHLMGHAGQARVGFDVAELAYEGGHLALSGDTRRETDTWVADLTLKADKWRLPFVRALVPAAVPYITALKADSVSGQISLAGPMTSLRVASHLDQGAGTWVLNGSAGVKAGALDALNLQGTLTHKNLAPLLQLMGLKAARNLPASLTVSATRQETGAPFALRLSGDLGGGQLIADGRMAPAGRKIQVTYDHKVAAQAFRRLGLTFPAPEPAQPVHADLTFALDGTDWHLDGVDVRNGGAALRGALAGHGTEGVTGTLSLAGYRVRTGKLGTTGQAAAEDSFQMPTGWEGYTGNLALAIDSLTVSGQRLDAPHASVTATGGELKLDLGTDAKLNGAPATGAFALKDGKAPALSGQMKLDSVDIGGFFKAQGLSAIASGTTALDFSFDATGATGDALLRSAKGHGALKGRAGTLNFLSVTGLVQQMTSAPTGISFLNAIGGLLRSGQTVYSDMDASFTLDGGTALVETAKAAGTWGSFALDGQINLLAKQMDMKGQLALSSPPDTPVIPVTYKGRLDDPAASWTSRALERFVIAGVESRLRSSLFKEQQDRAASGDAVFSNPGAAVFGQAFDLLSALKKKQETAATQKTAEPAKATDKKKTNDKPK